jgi:hypothetical protein
MEYISSLSMLMTLIYSINIKCHDENTEAPLQAVLEFGLEVNTEKSKYMFTSRHQNAGQNYNLSVCLPICLPVSCLNLKRSEYTKLQFYLLFCKGVKCGFLR